MTSNRHIQVAIIGAGFGGIGLGARLRRAGIEDFLIFERADGVGGTWWTNRYPGCACDVPAHLYSLSFFPNPDWSRWFAPRAEIQAYLEQCCDHHGLRDHLRLGCGIRQAKWDAGESRWHLATEGGQGITADVVVSAIGGLSRPDWPEIPGLRDFAGTCFHSQQWPAGLDLKGRRVAVIGTGASAAQIVPEIAGEVEHLDVYQRTPHWILPRPDAEIGAIRRWLFRHLPGTRKGVRFLIWLISEARVPGLAWSNRLAVFHKWLANRLRRRQVPDPVLRKKLEPDFDIGCKRVILSSDFYPALMRDNVELVDTTIERIENDAIVTRDGRRRTVDTIVLATGFRATDPVGEGMFIGRDGIDLQQHWQAGPEAWRGVMAHGFPNLFLLMGPNTALGHNSVILMIEAQIGFILRALERMREQRETVLEVSAKAQLEYNQWLQRRLARTVWNTGGCSSWYLHPVSGRNTTLWPGFTWTYRRMMRSIPA
ncbi:MAG: flavin-containing monooxygenase, partial [Wenzhouxiangellaceae bacterium]